MNIMLPNMQIEFMYALIAAILLFLIYTQTKEFYNLTKHRGIHYFRNAFLFLAIAHIFRFVSYFFMLSEAVPMRMLSTTNQIIVTVGFSLFTVFSFLGILHLTYSSIHKKISKGLFSKSYSLYIIALVLFMPVLFFGNIQVFLAIQALLVLFAFIMSAVSFEKQRQKRKHSMHILYGLFLLFWIVGMFAQKVLPIHLGIKIGAYAIGLGIIGIILYKVIKKTKM